MDIRIFTSPTCGYCHKAKAFLSQRGLQFTEYDVSRNRAAAEEVRQLTGQMGVPVISVDGEVVIGFNRPRLEQLLAQSGHKRHPHLGLKVASASTITGKTGRTPVFGAFVGAVAPSSPGERAGLTSGDIITEANLRRVNNTDDLESTIASLNHGSRAKITFLRGQQTLQSEILI